jgi:hypothetical protein
MVRPVLAAFECKITSFFSNSNGFMQKNKRVLISYYMCTFAPDIATPHTQVPDPMTIQEVSEKNRENRGYVNLLARNCGFILVSQISMT